MHFRLLLFSAVSWIHIHSAIAEICNGVVQGKVLEFHSKTGLTGATVQILNSKLGAITDENGTFVFKGLCPGKYQLQIKFIGYETTTSEVLLTSDQKYEVNIFMDEVDHYLQHVVVNGVETSQLTYNTSSLNESAITSGGYKGLGNLLSDMPGVSTLNTGPGISKPIIQGLHSNRVTILNNGIRQEGQQWGSEHAPEIDPYIATKITVVKGAASVRYGSDAIGGLIIVEPADLHRTNSIGGEINLVGMSNSRMVLASGMLEGGIGKAHNWGWRLQGTGKRAGDSHAPDYMLSNTGIEELNISAAIGYNDENKSFEFFYSKFDTNLGILRSAHTGSRTDFLESIARAEPLIIEPFGFKIDNPRQKVTHNLYKLNSHYTISDRLKLNLIYGGQSNTRLEYDRRRGSLFDTPALDLTLTTHTLDVILESNDGQNLQGSYGLNGLAQMNRWDPNTGKNPLIPWYNQQNIGAFVVQRYLQPTWEIEFGARYDFKQMLIKTFNRQKELLQKSLAFDNLAFNLGFQKELNSNVSVSSNIGTAWRPPHVSELLSNGVHHGTASYEAGLLIDEREEVQFENDNIQSESSIKWINSLSYKKNGVKLGMDGFINRINNFIYLAPVPDDFVLTSRGDFPLLRYQQIDAIISGFDTNIEFQFSNNLTYEFNASLLVATNRSSDEYIVWMPANQFENNVKYHSNGTGSVSNLHASLGSIYVARQNRVNPEQDFMDAPDGYFLLNAHVGFDVPALNNTLNISLNVDNLLNTTYRDYLNRFRYFADDLGRNFTLSLKYNFHNHN